jgi:glycosyltransferase 2 family protein
MRRPSASAYGKPARHAHLNDKDPSRRSAAAAWLLGLLALGALVTFVARRAEIAQFARLLHDLQPRWFVVALALQMLSQLSSAAVWYLVFRFAAHPCGFGPLLRVRLAMIFANEALPSAGLAGSASAIRGLGRLGIPPNVVVGAIVAGVMTTYAAGGIAVVAAIALLQPYRQVSPRVLVWAIVVSGAVVGAFIALTWRRGTMANAEWRMANAEWLKRIPRVAAALDTIATAPVGVLHSAAFWSRAIAFQLAVLLLDSCTLFVLLTALGARPAPVVVFGSFMIATAATGAIPLPGNLGAFEAALVAMLHLFGFRLEPALAAALLLRGFTVWLPMIPGVWFARP